MNRARVRTRDWVALGIVTGVALIVLAWAASKPAVCALALPCPGQQARILPAVTGAVAIIALAATTALLARRNAGRVREGVRSSEGIVAAGATLIGLAGAVSAVITLFSAGFALTL